MVFRIPYHVTHALLPTILTINSVRRLHSIANSLSFPSSSVVPALAELTPVRLPTNRTILQQHLWHVFHPHRKYLVFTYDHDDGRPFVKTISPTYKHQTSCCIFIVSYVTKMHGINFWLDEYVMPYCLIIVIHFKETSSCIAAPIRSSTSAIYDSKW